MKNAIKFPAFISKQQAKALSPSTGMAEMQSTYLAVLFLRLLLWEYEFVRHSLCKKWRDIEYYMNTSSSSNNTWVLQPCLRWQKLAKFIVQRATYLVYNFVRGTLLVCRNGGSALYINKYFLYRRKSQYSVKSYFKISLEYTLEVLYLAKNV